MGTAVDTELLLTAYRGGSHLTLILGVYSYDYRGRTGGFQIEKVWTNNHKSKENSQGIRDAGKRGKAPDILTFGAAYIVKMTVSGEIP